MHLPGTIRGRGGRGITAENGGGDCSSVEAGKTFPHSCKDSMAVGRDRRFRRIRENLRCGTYRRGFERERQMRSLWLYATRSFTGL